MHRVLASWHGPAASSSCFLHDALFTPAAPASASLTQAGERRLRQHAFIAADPSHCGAIRSNCGRQDSSVNWLGCAHAMSGTAAIMNRFQRMAAEGSAGASTLL